jgi:thiol-disulfide isomerase/thioredoxin
MDFFYNLFKPNNNLSKALNIILIILIIILLGLTISYTTKLREDFESNSANNLMIFYAEWCGYCRTAMPAFQKLKKDYNNQTINNQKVSIELIEGDKHKNLMTKYNVGGFPTVLLEKSNGQIVKYQGNRSYDDLVVFLRENL